jgi:hypothetical protein
MTTYAVTVNGEERLQFYADLSNAASQVTYLDSFGDWCPTPFQTADGRHSEEELAELLNGWLYAEGGAAWDAGEDIEVSQVDEEEEEEIEEEEGWGQYGDFA